jgi:hypothetical protein
MRKPGGLTPPGFVPVLLASRRNRRHDVFRTVKIRDDAGGFQQRAAGFFRCAAGRAEGIQRGHGFAHILGLSFVLLRVVIVDMASDNPYLVCDCSWANPLNMDEYKNAVAGDDPVEMLRIFTDRLSERVGLIEAERAERGIPFETLTIADCRPKSKEADLEGSVIVIKPEKLTPEYRTADHQLCLCTGGNGARPDARGRAVFTKNLYSGKSGRFERRDIAGIISPDRLPDWAREKLAALQKPAEKESVVDKIRRSNEQGAQAKPKTKKRDKGGPEL